MGIVLALLVAITKNIIPGILFHIVFNISGTVANARGGIQIYLLTAILAVSVCYALYLIRFVPGKGEADASF